MEKAYKIILLSIFCILVFVTCNSVNYMRIATFFQPVRDNEKADVTTNFTIPDQSLSVRDILQRFTRGQITIPPIEEGDDDDIDSITNDFDDIVDAYDTIIDAGQNIKLSGIKGADRPTADAVGVEQSDTTMAEVKEPDEH